MALLTINHYINQVNNFIQNVKDTRHAFYMFAGRPYSWPSDSSPPVANNSLDQYQSTIYDDMIFGKLIKSTDVQFLVPRYNWVSNTVYAQYDPKDSDLYTKPFYVVTDNYQVFKCIYNSFGGLSTIKPVLTTTSGSFRTSDGYIWKYMYTIDITSNTKFTSSKYIPALQDSNVQANAVQGSIEAMAVLNGGSNYQVYSSGNIVKMISPTQIQLPNTASAYDNYYTKSSIYLKAGYGAGQVREIVSSSGGSKTITVSASNPFQIYQKIDVTGVIGSVTAGQTVQQPIDYMNYLYNVGYFNTGATVVQSDTGSTGQILAANSSTLQIGRVIGSTPFSLNLPIFDSSSSGVQKSGNVTITASSNTVLSTNTAQTSFTTNYSVGNYIRVGTNTNNNIRKITAVSTSTINVDIAFTSSIVNTSHYSITTAAAEPTSVTITQASGVVSNVNLNAATLQISNPSVAGQSFIIGEIVDLVDSGNNNQSSNGIVAYANTSSVFLSAVNDPNNNFGNNYFWSNNFFIKGESSQYRYLLNSATTNPNILISNPTGSNFVLGQKLYFVLTGTTTTTGNATIVSTLPLPNDSTEYEIAPTVKITGDGSGASAIAIVNPTFGSANNIVGIELINTGSGYTFANIQVYANGNFGSGAVISPLISPIQGHGYDTISELGARYAGVDITFDTGTNESFYYPTYGTYRRVGILEDPQFNDVRLTLSSFDRVNLNLNTSTYSIGPNSSWVPGEVVVQSTSNAAGVVVYGNSSFLQLKSVLGTFANNYKVAGYYSNTYANANYANVIYFAPTTNAEVVSEVTSGANGIITYRYTNTSIQLSNVIGHFVSGDTLYDNSSNAYATVTNIYTSNGQRDQTNTFGLRFNQTLRLTLTSNSGAFTNTEYVQQDATGANGRIMSTSDELDLAITSLSGSFSNGFTVSDQTTGANGVVIFANSSYIKLTSVSQSISFATGHTINNGSGSTATISQIFPVLTLHDINGSNRFQATSNNIVGQTSGAIGQVNSYNLITYPELVRESGKVIYMENISPVTRTQSSKEEFKLVVKF